MSEKRDWCALEGRGVTFGEGSCVMCCLARARRALDAASAVAVGPQQPINPAPRAPKEGWKQ